MAALQKQHQKILRNLMKVPSNKKCADCGEQCAVQVDTTNGIFLCSICSGIHREFGFRIKSVSMASFTPEEIQKLQSTNNDEFNRVWMAKWKSSEDPFPVRDDSNYNSRIAFLRRKYMDKVWYKKGGKVQEPAPQQAPPPVQQPQQQAPPQQDLFGFGGPAQAPAPSPAPAQNQAWSPFGNQPAQQPAQQPAAPSNPVDDLLNFGTPTPQQQQQTSSRNDIKNLLDLMGPSTPQPQQPQTSALRQGGFGNQGGFGAPQQGGFGNAGFGNQGGFNQQRPQQGGFGQAQGGFGNQGGFNQQRPQQQQNQNLFF